MSVDSFEHLLGRGETIPEIDAPKPDSREWQYGYRTVEIGNSEHTKGNSVFLEVEPQGAVEPVSILDRFMLLTVQAVEGSGYAVIDHGIETAFKGQAPGRLQLINEDLPPAYLAGGETYYYLNPNDTRLVLRDDATPAFKGDEEQSLFHIPRDESGRPIENQLVRVSSEFLVAFGALSNLRHDQLNLRECIIPNAIYRGNHGISYRALTTQRSADGYELTGKTTEGVEYVQLDDGGYPAGTLWWRSEAEFLRGTETVDGQEKPIFSLQEMPLNKPNLELVTGSRL